MYRRSTEATLVCLGLLLLGLLVLAGTVAQRQTGTPNCVVLHTLHAQGSCNPIR